MKKILFIFIAVVVLVVAALVVFTVTFDANRYRDRIEKEASDLLGHPVQIGNIALGWRGGLALEVDGVKVLSNDEPVLTVANAGAVLELAPLLRSNIQIASIFIDGADIRAVKNQEGQIKILGVDLAGKEATEVSLPQGGQLGAPQNLPPTLASFLIAKINLTHIHVYYQDDSAEFPVQLDWQDISLSLENVSFFKPITFHAEGAFFGKKKNLKVDGIIKLEDKGQIVRIENFKGEADLDAIEREELVSSVPELMRTVPMTDWGGKLEMSIDSLRIKNGKPESLQADFFLKNGFMEDRNLGRFVREIDLTAKQVNFNSPFEVQLKAAAFSSSTNVNFQGKVEASNLGRVIIGPAQFDADLNALNWDDLNNRLPAMRSSVIAGAPEGRIHADIRRMSFEPGSTPLGDINFRYDQGKVRLKDLPQALSNIQMTGNLRGDQLSLDVWNISYGNSPAEGRLNVQNLFTQPLFRFEAKGRSFNLKELLPPPATPKDPSLEGTLSFNVSMGGRGNIPEIIIPSLNGSGSFQIENGVIRNMNLLEEILTRLSAIPGLSSALNQRMSDSMKARRSRPDTPLETIDEDFSIENGFMRFNQFDATTPNLKLSGPITLGADTSIQARPVIWIHEEIMAELVDRVHELAYALNRQGQLQVPVSISGNLAKMNIFPDIQFLLGEIVRNKAGQLLAGQIAKKAEGNEKLDVLSQFLGTTNSAQKPESVQTSTLPNADSSVPVKVHPSEQTPQSKPSNSEIAVGLINAFLSNSSSGSNDSSGN